MRHNFLLMLTLQDDIYFPDDDPALVAPAFPRGATFMSQSVRAELERYGDEYWPDGTRFVSAKGDVYEVKHNQLVKL